MAKVTLKGSERTPLEGAQVLAPADPNERLEVSMIVRRCTRTALQTRVAKLAAGNSSVGFLSREEFAEEHGADPCDLGKVRKFAAAHHLIVVQEHAARRTVVLSGTVEQFSDAFSVQMQKFTHSGGTYRGRMGAIQLPVELDGIIEAVLGLDNRPQAKPHFRVRPTGNGKEKQAGATTSVSFSPTQVASLYGFPSGTGAGQCVAIIELGGGYRPADLQAYFTGLDVGSPKVSAVSVDHGNNTPTGDANGPDGEVMLDIEVVGSIVPAANIAVYFGPNTDAGFLDAVTTAIHDKKNRPSVISISWGGPESAWTAQAMTAMDDAFQAAAAMGITVCVASGDSGSTDGVSDGNDHVDFPASSPYALGLRRHEPAGESDDHHERSRVERRRERRREWRRHQQLFPDTGLADGQESNPTRRHLHRPDETRSARRGRRCRSADGIRRANRRHRHRHRRHECRRAALGRADRSHQSSRRYSCGISESDAVQQTAGAARHYQRQQRGLRGRQRLGRVHRSRNAEWCGAAGCDLRSVRSALQIPI